MLARKIKEAAFDGIVKAAQKDDASEVLRICLENDLNLVDKVSGLLCLGDVDRHINSHVTRLV